MKFILFFFLVLFTLNLSAMTITHINYKGMIHISQPVALRMLKFEVGDEINENLIDNAIKAYYKQGYFQDIWADYDDGILTFNFVEKAIISQIVLEGWKENDAEEIQATVIQIKKGSLYNAKKLQEAKKRIIAAISQDGSIDSVVEIEEELLENGSMKVTFVVNEGEEIIIEKLQYNGVIGLDSDDFDDVIANKEHEWAGWLFGRNDGEMSLPDLEYDNMRIRDYYMQYGYLDSRVEQPFVRVNFDSYTAEMSYDIEEGPVYTINSISINQIKDVVEEEKIREVITLKNGEVFNIKTFRADAKTIKTLIADLSYAFVQVIPDLQKNKENNTVDVIFKIIPGDKVKIRDVIISGNTRTLDRVIRRELYLGAGDMYSLTDLQDSKNALGRLGYFDANAIEEKRVDNETMDLVVKVKEAATGNIQIGGGYGSFGGLLLSFGISDNNIWGSGINMGISLEKSQTSANASFNISNPRLNDSDFSGNFSIYANSSEYNNYTVDSAGINIGTGHRFTRYITGYLGYGYSDNQYETQGYANYIEENSNRRNISRVAYNERFESYSKSSTTVSVKYDDTDDFYLPRSGITASQSLEKAGLGGDADFVKSRTEFGSFKGLDDYLGLDVIARYKARYFHLFDTGSIPLAERFHMGGIGSIRGYESYSISPLYDNTDDRKGGTQTFSNSAELSFPLVPKAKMRLVTFIDYGVIKDSTSGNISRAGYGVGLEWFSPVGPIQLIFARPLLQEDGDRTAPFEFTMGRRF